MNFTLPEKLVPYGRGFFATALLAFGVQHLVYRDFVTRLVPSWPGWIPERPIWAGVFGVALILLGGAILFRRTVRLPTLWFGVLLLFSVGLLYAPQLAANPRWGGLWTNTFKALALSGGTFAVAGTLPVGRAGGVERALTRLVPAGRFLLGAFFVLCGAQHFIYANFVAMLVPAWIPGHAFWTCFSGLALIAGGVGLLLKPTARLAALLSGLMVFAWVFLLHLARVLAAPRDANETTAIFEALAVSGIAFVLAGTLTRRTAKSP